MLNWIMITFLSYQEFNKKEQVFHTDDHITNLIGKSENIKISSICWKKIFNKKHVDFFLIKKHVDLTKIFKEA